VSNVLSQSHLPLFLLFLYLYHLKSIHHHSILIDLIQHCPAVGGKKGEEIMKFFFEKKIKSDVHSLV
jgi:hypothetical protein